MALFKKFILLPPLRSPESFETTYRLPMEESDLGPYRVQFGPLWTDFTAKEYTSFFIYAVPQLDTSCVLERKKLNLSCSYVHGCSKLYT